MNLSEDPKEITAKVALNRLRKKLPYSWDLNIYRGCIHGCKYCFARYSHQYLKENSDNFFSDVFVKTNIAEVLDRELSSKNWKKEIINIGGVTDSYQALEKKYKIMRKVLKVILKHKNPIIISTKSDLILRDFDLISELSQVACVNIACTITTKDEKIRQKIEPQACSTEKRFKVLEQFKKTGASVGIHVMPVIPFITDNKENLESIFQYASHIEVDYLLPGTLYLRGDTRKYFLQFIKNEFPEIYGKYLYLYRQGGANRLYKNKLYKMINNLRKKYQVSSNYMKPLQERMKKFKTGQLSFGF